MRGIITEELPEYYTEVVRVVKNKPEKYDETERVLIIDFDSVIHLGCHFPPDSLVQFPTEELQLEEAKFRVRNKLQEIQNNVEEHFKIVKTLLFVGGVSNFRYKIFSEYKIKRKLLPINPLIPILKEYTINELGAIPANGCEADDLVIECMKLSSGNAVVSSIDKDVLYYSPNVPFYNYRSYGDTIGEFKYMTEKESRLAIASQLVTGDVADSVAGAVGCGAAYCKKNLHEDMTDYQFIKNIFKAYLKSTKGDSVEAKRQMKLYYKVLKLHTQEEIKTLLSKENLVE
jgi:hypothetical protein